MNWTLPYRRFVVVGLAVILFSATLRQNYAAEATSLSVEPASIQLVGNSSLQQLLITARAAGRPVDVTHSATIVSDNPAVVRIERGVALPVGDGSARLTATSNGVQVEVPVTVSSFRDELPVHFGNDVMPLLSKLGCNSGGCHGKASGQNGFKLSVFGFDPAADYEAIVKAGRGRRVFPASPANSLLLAKPSASVPHGGGRRLEVGSANYALLHSWVASGAPAGRDDAPQVARLEISPTERTLSPDGQQQILATAHYTDGSHRDVTALAAYTSNAPAVAEVDAAGLVHAQHKTGEAAITVNFMGQVASVALQIPRPTTGNSPPLPPLAGRIDELVWAKLATMGITAAPLADDALFLRRLYLDTIGTLPKPEEVRQFLADRDPAKRGVWIDRVLARPELADFWALKWCDILLVDREKLGERGAFELHHWLRDEIARNRPYDQWVRQLITASGDSATNGPVNLYRAVDTPEALARVVSQSFLGVRLECAQCHHHPYDRWSQDDFYSLAAYFSGLERKPLGRTKDRALVFHSAVRETRIPLSNKLVTMRPLVGSAPVAGNTDPRVALADWVTARENPWFARLAANRIWKHFLGRGLVEPEDDLRSTNPATNERLLAHLSEQLIAAKYDLKSLMRSVISSRVYQLSGEANESNRDDEQNFSHRRPRRMSAEVMLDAISEVTGVAEAFPGSPAGTRAIALWDNRLPSYFLEAFGRPERTSPCECGRSSEPTMSQALHLMNAPEIEGKIGNSAGRVAKLLAAGKTQRELVNELCLAALGREPRAKEIAVAQQLFAVAEPREAAEDFLWALLNSYDFIFVH